MMPGARFFLYSMFRPSSPYSPDCLAEMSSEVCYIPRRNEPTLPPTPPQPANRPKRRPRRYLPPDAAFFKSSHQRSFDTGAIASCRWSRTPRFFNVGCKLPDFPIYYFSLSSKVLHHWPLCLSQIGKPVDFASPSHDRFAFVAAAL